MRYMISLAVICLIFGGVAFGQQTTSTPTPSAPPSSAVPLPDKVAPENPGELSCHAQQEKQKNADGTTTDVYRPWLRTIRPDKSVWSQKRKTFPTQLQAQQECEAWVEIASRIRALHQLKIDHDKVLTSHDRRMAAIEDNNNALQSDTKQKIQGLQDQIVILRLQLNRLVSLPEVQKMFRDEAAREQATKQHAVHD